MEKCFIAISQRLFLQEYGEVREALALDWGAFFKEYLNDFLMLPLSYTQDFNRYKSSIAGVILSGGNDLSVCNDNALNRQRDNFESSIIESCIKDSIPLLGICRGAQMIAHYFNSTIKKCNNHTKPHEISVNLDSIYACSPECKSEIDSIESKNFHCFSVNSYHNYAIQSLGENLSALAIYGSKEDLRDFSIEAFRHDFYNIFGIMWHIERLGGMNWDFIFSLWKNAIKSNLT